MHDLDIPPVETKTKQTLPQSYILASCLSLLIVGLAIGGYLGFRSLNQDNLSSEPQFDQSEVLGESQEQSPHNSATSTPSETPPVNPPAQATANQEPPKAAATTPAPAPTAKPQVKKDTRCSDAKAELTAALAANQKEYDTAIVGAKATYDQEQAAAIAKLATASRQRNEAVNQYLTAIALATSKYNSSTATDAYQIYQQEQAAALNLYNQAISKITTEEEIFKTDQKDSQSRYDSAVSLAKVNLESKNTAAQSQYQEKTKTLACN